MSIKKITMTLHTLTSSQKQKILDDILQRILHVVQPRRILLFGSTARGQMTTDSDLDLLVIVSGPIHRRQIEQKIYANLLGIRTTVDAIVATEEDIEKFVDSIGMIYRPALQEGKLVYEA